MTDDFWPDTDITMTLFEHWEDYGTERQHLLAVDQVPAGALPDLRIPPADARP